MVNIIQYLKVVAIWVIFCIIMLSGLYLVSTIITDSPQLIDLDRKRDDGVIYKTTKRSIDNEIQ